MILAREQSEVVASLTAPPDYHEPTVVITYSPLRP